jgi:N-methylhydantoinase B
MTPTTTEAGALDVVTFGILRSTLANMVHEMGLHLERAAFSPSIVEGRDFTLALMDRDGSMVANGPEDQPAHLGTLEFSTRAVIEAFRERGIREGDFYLFNDPYTGGTHCQDIRVVHPVFRGGELFAWLLAVGHWTDVGGPFPGTFNPIATSSYAEGIRLPAVRYIEDGARREDIVDVVLANCRLPNESRGDLMAMEGAIVAGEARLTEVVEKYGEPAVLEAFAKVMDHSEQLLLAQTSKLPDGVYEAADVMDMDPPHPDQPPVHVRGRLEVKDGRLIFDFGESDPEPRGSIGGTLPTTWSGVLCAVMNFFPGVPFNHGIFRVIELKTKPGTCVHITPPTPFSGMAAGALEKVIGVVLRALSATQERRTAAMYNLCNMTLAGHDPRFGDREWIMYLWLPGGFGATSERDAGLPTMMLYGPGCRNQPVEVHERLYPILYEKVGMRPDSMGVGRYRGGLGVECVFRLTDGAEASLSAIGDRNRFPVWGMDEGGDGGTQDIVLGFEEDEPRSLGMHAAGVDVVAGRKLRYYSAGGGGYGHAVDRDPAAVLEDVKEEFLSVEAAARDYGVVIRDGADGPEVDAEATAARRAAGIGGAA